MTHRVTARRSVPVTVSVLTCFFALSLVLAEQPTTKPGLKVGDIAPVLKGKWLKGEPVKSFESGKIYVVEFWATWCGPCIVAMPHLSKLQSKYEDQGIIIIGQDAQEEDPAKVERFVRRIGEAMSYRVVMDDVDAGIKSGTTADAWGMHGLPCSFIIDRQGKIAWIGHPMSLEPILDRVVAGTFDPAKQAEIEALDFKLGGGMWEAARKGDTAQALKLLEEVQRVNPDANIPQIRMDILLNDASRKLDWDAALAVLDEYQQKHPQLANEIDRNRLDILWKQKKDYDAATKVARRLVDSKETSAYVLNTIAWRLATTSEVRQRDLDLAEEAAKRSVDLTGGTHGSTIDTYARVKFEQGDLDKAIELQTQAVENTDNGEMRTALAATLAEYQAKRAEKAAE